MVSQINLLTTHHSLLTNKCWKHKVELEVGIKKMYDTYKWYLGNTK